MAWPRLRPKAGHSCPGSISPHPSSSAEKQRTERAQIRGAEVSKRLAAAFLAVVNNLNNKGQD